jgi:hypothetical protein
MAPAINNVLNTGGGNPGIKQATLISGVGVAVPGGGASGGGSNPAVMTVNVNGNGSIGGATTNAPGQTGQNTQQQQQQQTLVLAKGPHPSSIGGVVVGQPGMTVAMASSGSTIGSNQNNSNNQGGAPTPQTPGSTPQSIAIGIGTGSGGGVQILNMNSLNAVRASTVNVGAVNVSGGGGPQMATMMGSAGGRGGAGQRMIISPQMLANARQGQPGVRYKLLQTIRMLLMNHYEVELVFMKLS